MPAERQMTAVGFEPTPLRTGAWSQRLRPLGQTVLSKCSAFIDISSKTRRMSKSYKTGSTEKRQLQSKPNLTPYETPHIPGLGAFYEIDKTSLNSPIGAWHPFWGIRGNPPRALDPPETIWNGFVALCKVAKHTTTNAYTKICA